MGQYCAASQQRGGRAIGQRIRAEMDLIMYDEEESGSGTIIHSHHYGEPPATLAQHPVMLRISPATCSLSVITTGTQ